MQLILEQTFPLGRFHATPWKVFPYDDPHGEWPPSPWRLVRAVLARSYQLDREIADPIDSHANLREELVHAFATSEIVWQLPQSSWRGPGLRQYHPAEFRRVPATASEPGMMAYNTTKVLDNFWVTSGAAEPVFWLIDGTEWKREIVAHLDQCLARMTYFGRAESITEIRRIESAPSFGETVKLSPRRSGNGKSVPVLVLQPTATLAQVEANTDAPSVRDTSIPPGSCWMYAERPSRPRVAPAKRPVKELPPAKLIQFAIGYTVEPSYKDAVRITERFRNRAIKCLEQILRIPPKTKWFTLIPEVRDKIHRFAGRDAEGKAASGHAHASYLLCGESHPPSRLCVWRDIPFTPEEQRAILNAASIPLPLSYRSDSWTLTLVPLDNLVPAPPGLDKKPSRVWRTLTPYVPPRHVYNRKGCVKKHCSVKEQVAAELAERVTRQLVEIAVDDYGWAKVHVNARKGNGPPNCDKRGYHITLTFNEEVSGPISLGLSSHFGLGLFVPVGD